jgi:hypothetical protein
MPSRIWLVLIVLCVPLVPESASLAQSGKSYLIVAGQFGSWKLGTSEWEALPVFTEALGPDFSSGSDPSFKSARNYFWSSAGIKLVVGARGRVVGIFAWRRYGPPEVTKANDELVKYRTDRDIGIGSPLSAVRTAYGPTDTHWEVRWSKTFINTAMRWDNAGIYVEIHNGTVDAIGVYEPTAWVGAE